MEPVPQETLRAQLQATKGPVQGTDLKAHLERDAVVLVGPGCDLVTVALAVAQDDAGAVGAWLSRGELRKPDARERAEWPLDDARRWDAVVVQPFVLVQELLS